MWRERTMSVGGLYDVIQKFFIQIIMRSGLTYPHILFNIFF